jgi:hypothetical protein
MGPPFRLSNGLSPRRLTCRVKRTTFVNIQVFLLFNSTSCFFQPGYYGDPEVSCIAIGCTSDSECLDTHACRQGDCHPVCGVDGLPCGGEAVCAGVNHRAVCTCPPGLTGDPYVTCSATECTDNSECPPDRACVNKKCQDVCAIESPCEKESECKVRNHEPDCKCPVGLVGDRGKACQAGKWKNMYAFWRAQLTVYRILTRITPLLYKKNFLKK